MDGIDRERFPRLVEYLQSLPANLDSYPECVTKASIIRSVLEGRVLDRDVNTLPAPLRDAMVTPPPANVWIPEALAVAVHYAIGDADHLTPEEVLDITYKANKRMTRSPMYRALAMVTSPRIMLKTAELGWGLLHRGVKLEINGSPNSAVLKLTHPPNVWNTMVHRSAATGFRAVVEAAHGYDVRYEIVSSTPTDATFEVHWT